MPTRKEAPTQVGNGDGGLGFRVKPKKIKIARFEHSLQHPQNKKN